MLGQKPVLDICDLGKVSQLLWALASSFVKTSLTTCISTSSSIVSLSHCSYLYILSRKSRVRK